MRLTQMPGAKMIEEWLGRDLCAARQVIEHEKRSARYGAVRSGRLCWRKTVTADRDYPPFDRSTRDGYAVRAADAAGPARTLKCDRRNSRGRQRFDGDRARGRMRADHDRRGRACRRGRRGDDRSTPKREGRTRFASNATPEPGQNIVPRGTRSARRAERCWLRERGWVMRRWLSAAQVGARGAGGAARAAHGDSFYGRRSGGRGRRRRGRFQIRNSNGVSLAAQVRLAGGEPVLLGNAPDRAKMIATRQIRARAGRGYSGAFGRRFDGEVRFGRESVEGAGRGILF